MSDMDDNRPVYSLQAPGAAGASSPPPRSRAGLPRIDDRLVVPEVTRDEIIKGRRVVAMPADAPHGDQHFRLDYVVGAHVAPGYEGSTELLTRTSAESDFASDACIRKTGKDPETGSRYLEEIAFEVVSTQSERNVTEKAEEMHGRGVRRIFAIFIKGPRRVCEWSPRSPRRWQVLDAGARIEDPCLVAPLAVSALLDAALADNAVLEALIAKNNPLYLERVAAAEARGKAKGEAKGAAEAILKVLEARGMAVSPAQREEILRCADLARLSRWVIRAAVAASADEVTAEP